MVQVTARLPDALGAELDAAAQHLKRSRADMIRQAIEYYLDDIEDLRCGMAALKDPADPVIDWAEVRHALLAAHEAHSGQGPERATQGRSVRVVGAAGSPEGV